jgi:outer membrane protein assembly factor BamE
MMLYRSLICALIILTLSSCSFLHVRKPIIQQGNIITTEDVSRLHPGMSPQQVAEIMGQPVLNNVFASNRIEYVYTYEDGSNPRLDKRLVCVFSNGRLVEILRS